MIRTLRGNITTLLTDACILEAHGVGYEVFVTPTFLRQAELNSEVMLSTYHHVREDVQLLFGFETLADREMFALLTTVSGVGPKTALLVLDAGHQRVLEALKNSDVAFFQSVPRLGKKTAQKILVELQSKVGADAARLWQMPSQVERDVEEALVAMGYNSTDVAPLLSKIEPDWNTEQALKWALQQLR